MRLESSTNYLNDSVTRSNVDWFDLAKCNGALLFSKVKGSELLYLEGVDGCHFYYMNEALLRIWQK